MKRLLCLIIAVIMTFAVTGCDKAGGSSEPESVSSDISAELSAMEQIEQNCGADCISYEAEDYTLYIGNGMAYAYNGNKLTEYLFNTGYKSGDYEIEIYDENDWRSGGHIILRMEHGEITDVLPFYKSDMFRSLGQGKKLDVTCDEKLTVGKLYCQLSRITINFDFLEDDVSADQYMFDVPEVYSPLATRQDGAYTILNRHGDSNNIGCDLMDNATGEYIVLDSIEYDYGGFLPDGNIYLQSLENYKILSTDGKVLFNLSSYFPTGTIDEQKGINRKICGVYQDVNHSRYYVVYFDRGSSGTTGYVPGTFLLYDTYKVAVMDENSEQQKIIETGKYAETKNSFYRSVEIRDVNEYTICFYIETYNTLEFEVFVDLNTNEVTLRDYRQWE